MSFYINFKEETGNIWKLTNEKDTSTPYIEIEVDLYRQFAKEEKLLDDYIVVPSGKEELKYELSPKNKDLLSFDVDLSIHQWPKVSSVDTNNAFIVTQDVANGKWIVSMTKQLRTLLTQTPYYKEKTVNVHITQEDNPNILLNTLAIKMWTILYEPEFIIEDLVAKRTDVSLYCGKIFENYLHVVDYED
jgi:hypothetical protein